MNVVILGATGGMGREVGRCFAASHARLFLLGRNEDALQRSATDFELRGASAGVQFARCDLRRPADFAPALERAVVALGTLDAVIVTAGTMTAQDVLEADPASCAEHLSTNFCNTILFCEEARRRLLAQGGGCLCLFSSVAGERARKPVILYGAAKAGLSYYMNGLDHKFHGRGLTTVLVKPGFVRTSMTAGMKPPPFAGEPEHCARLVVKAIRRGTPVVYVPSIWRIIMMVIRLVPRSIMRRAEF